MVARRNDGRGSHEVERTEVVSLVGGRSASVVEAPDPETGGRAVHLVVRDRVLDRLRDGRWISMFQYDAGLRLWELYEAADVRLGVRAADLQISVGKGQQVAIGNSTAYAEYMRCLRLVHVAGRGVVIAVCIDDLPVQEYARQRSTAVGDMIERLQRGLGRLAREFSDA